MTHIDVLIEAFGQTLRVSGMFTPSRPAITAGPPDNWEPADPAEWDECTVTLAYGQDDLTDLLDRVRVPNTGGQTALDYVRDLAEQTWVERQRTSQGAA